MTKALAIEASRRLNDIEDFECFMDEIDGTIKDFEGFISPAFLKNLNKMMEDELSRLNKKLADLKGE